METRHSSEKRQRSSGQNHQQADLLFDFSEKSPMPTQYSSKRERKKPAGATAQLGDVSQEPKSPKQEVSQELKKSVKRCWDVSSASSSAFNVTVRRLCGGEFEVQLSQTENSVEFLMSNIASLEGISPTRQTLFVLCETSETQQRLTPTDTLDGSCTVILTVQAVLDGWGKCSATQMEISNTNVSYTSGGSYGLATGNVQVDKGESAYWEVQVEGEMKNMFVGVVEVGLDHDTSHYLTKNGCFVGPLSEP